MGPFLMYLLAICAVFIVHIELGSGEDTTTTTTSSTTTTTGVCMATPLFPTCSTNADCNLLTFGSSTNKTVCNTSTNTCACIAPRLCCSRTVPCCDGRSCPSSGRCRSPPFSLTVLNVITAKTSSTTTTPTTTTPTTTSTTTTATTTSTTTTPTTTSTTTTPTTTSTTTTPTTTSTTTTPTTTSTTTTQTTTSTTTTPTTTSTTTTPTTTSTTTTTPTTTSTTTATPTTTSLTTTTPTTTSTTSTETNFTATTTTTTMSCSNVTRRGTSCVTNADCIGCSGPFIYLPACNNGMCICQRGGFGICSSTVPCCDGSACPASGYCKPALLNGICSTSSSTPSKTCQVGNCTADPRAVAAFGATNAGFCTL